MREFEGARGGDGLGKGNNNSRPPNPGKGKRFAGRDKGKSKGKGNGYPRPQRAYVAETPDLPNTNEDDPDNDDPGEEPLDDDPSAADDANPNEEEEMLPTEDEDDDDYDAASELSEVAKCLTVTARRLQGLTLGRKFGGNSKSLAQRKAESHCAACGQRGHWQGDSECPHTAGSNGSLLEP